MSTTSSGRFYRFCGVDGILRLNYKTHGCVDSTNQPKSISSYSLSVGSRLILYRLRRRSPRALLILAIIAIFESTVRHGKDQR